MKPILFLLLISHHAFSQDYIANWNGIDSMVMNYEVDYSADNSAWNSIAEIPKGGQSSYAYTLPFKPGYYKVVGVGSTDIASNTILLSITFSVAINNPLYKPSSLTWSTTNENNVSYYLLEKTTSGRTTLVHKEPAKGNSNYTYPLSRTMKKYTYRITPVYRNGLPGQAINFK